MYTIYCLCPYHKRSSLATDHLAMITRNFPLTRSHPFYKAIAPVQKGTMLPYKRELVRVCACVHAFVRACVNPVYIWITRSPSTWCLFEEIRHPSFQGLDPPIYTDWKVVTCSKYIMRTYIDALCRAEFDISVAKLIICKHVRH